MLARAVRVATEEEEEEGEEEEEEEGDGAEGDGCCLLLVDPPPPLALLLVVRDGGTVDGPGMRRENRVKVHFIRSSRLDPAYFSAVTRATAKGSRYFSRPTSLFQGERERKIDSWRK